MGEQSSVSDVVDTQNKKRNETEWNDMNTCVFNMCCDEWQKCFTSRNYVLNLSGDCRLAFHLDRQSLYKKRTQN